MAKITQIPHTADTRIRVEAVNLQELFTGALEGMNKLLKRDSCTGETTFTVRDEIHLQAPDVTALLVDFLSEILTLSCVNKAVYCQAEFLELGNRSLRAIIHGKETIGFDEDIKAVTYHEAGIRQNEKGHFETRLLFDI